MDFNTDVNPFACDFNHILFIDALSLIAQVVLISGERLKTCDVQNLKQIDTNYIFQNSVNVTIVRKITLKIIPLHFYLNYLLSNY